MKRNVIKIVCNPYTDRVSYFFKNELDEWVIFSESSPLSRKYYTNTSLEQRSSDIVKKLDEVYNRKNKGLDIYYEGPDDGYFCLSKAIKECLQNSDVVGKRQTTKIVVVGKTGSGKTTLINGIADNKGYKIEITNRGNYVQYDDNINHIQWFEINGSNNIEENDMKNALSLVRQLSENGLSKVIYCIAGDSGRIEDTERVFLSRVNDQFPEVTTIIALTKCYKDESQFVVDEVEKITEQMPVFPLLAMEYKANKIERGMAESIRINPFGLKEFCSFLFEGKKVSYSYLDSYKAAVQLIKKEKSTKGDQVKNTDILKAEKKGISDATKSIAEKSISGSIKDVQGKNNNEQVGISKYDEMILPSFAAENTNINVDSNLSFHSGAEKIIVVGKRGAGKTTLIEGLEKISGLTLNVSEYGKYRLYEDANGEFQWYEIKGIDLGKDEIDNAYKTIADLRQDSTAKLLYCISGGVGRIEEVELDLIRKLASMSSNNIYIVLTLCFKEDIQDTIDIIHKAVGNITIVQTLAKDYKTGIKIPGTKETAVISSFGLEGLYQMVCGGR
ncbi:MAG: hypothetical protein E7294_01195 [Lachnospiraceae bacterium]|nr:hypothetical protein [Lachnospiraceae bacterium]